MMSDDSQEGQTADRNEEIHGANSEPAMVTINPADKLTNETVVKPNSSNTEASADKTLVKNNTAGKEALLTLIPTIPFTNIKPAMASINPADKLNDETVVKLNDTEISTDKTIVMTDTIIGKETVSTPITTIPFTNTKPAMVSVCPVDKWTNGTVVQSNNTEVSAAKPENTTGTSISMSPVSKTNTHLDSTMDNDKLPISKKIRCRCERIKVNRLACGYCEDCSEYLCSLCISDHRRFVVLQNHKILPGAEMLDQQYAEGCSNHQNDLITFYCQQHDLVGCGQCMVLEHRQCDVKLISDILPEFDFRNTDLLQLLQSTTNNINKSTRNIVKAGKLTKEFYREALETIFHRRECIDELLDEQQKHAIDDIETKLNTDFAILDNLTKRLVVLDVDTRRIKNDFRYTAVSKTILSFIKRKQAVGKLRQVEMSRKDVQASFNGRQLSKLQGSELSPFLYQQLAFDVVCQRNNQSEINLKTAEITECRNIYLPIFGRSYNRWITGMASYCKDEIVAVDNLNYMLVVMLLESGEMSYFQRLPARPWDITSINDSHDKILAITFPFKQSIKLYDKDTLTEIRSIQVKGECHGIDYHEGKLAVSYVDPEKVEVLNTDGILLYRFDVDNTGTGLFTRPLYTCFSGDGDHVYVTENDEGSVMKISMTHPAVMIYKDTDLASPTAITTTSTGHLLVASRRYGTLNLLSENFTSFQTLIQTTFTALSEPDNHNPQPQSMLYNEQTGCIIVSLAVDQISADNCLKVYEAKSTGKKSVTATA